MQKVVETGVCNFHLHVFKLFLQLYCKKEIFGIRKKIIGSLKAPFKFKLGSVCAQQEVVVHLQKNRSPRRSLYTFVL